MKITSEIFQVGGEGLTSSEDAAVYLINFDGHSALVDTGCGRSLDKLIKNIQACGTRLEQIEYLLITHCHFDHTGGAKMLRERLQCRIIAHELDARFLEEGNDTVTAASWYGSELLPFIVDRKLSGPRERIELAGRIIHVIHTPGHSPGSVVYLTDSEGFKVLFAQDVHGPIHQSLLSDPQDYLRSLKLLLTLKADILCEGHFGIFKGKKEIEKFIRRFLDTI
ncbi:MAG TPA: MBL fold metallo-hydrolase [Desulfobacterales bacterium]|nr:MBL fold metallo-hydrolase [Desulfobacterales bacterium]